ncbi:hypothetical protein M758_1G002000 [Ceratodon purpureus]|uniref:Uncharacterized protein n=1 Tax=Ceratodon purpureus TaxID=3225 RepID=A0A8T0IZQ4_CERPU|nr:hypothetical protein KC19_1G003600 [Ceratodon purpureus]KAG0628116.1 hypothetical protein M758_1G002000 [Ceratodon purpureus]
MDSFLCLTLAMLHLFAPTDVKLKASNTAQLPYRRGDVEKVLNL